MPAGWSMSWLGPGVPKTAVRTGRSSSESASDRGDFNLVARDRGAELRTPVATAQECHTHRMFGYVAAHDLIVGFGPSSGVGHGLGGARTVDRVSRGQVRFQALMSRAKCRESVDEPRPRRCRRPPAEPAWVPDNRLSENHAARPRASERLGRGGGASSGPSRQPLAGEVFARPKREPGQVTSFRTSP
jgi:hypothetical protein